MEEFIASRTSREQRGLEHAALCEDAWALSKGAKLWVLLSLFGVDIKPYYNEDGRRFVDKPLHILLLAIRHLYVMFFVICPHSLWLVVDMFTERIEKEL